MRKCFWTEAVTQSDVFLNNSRCKQRSDWSNMNSKHNVISRWTLMIAHGTKCSLWNKQHVHWPVKGGKRKRIIAGLLFEHWFLLLLLFFFFCILCCLYMLLDIQYFCLIYWLTFLCFVCGHTECNNKIRDCTFKRIRLSNVWWFNHHSSSTVYGQFHWPRLPERGQLGRGVIKELLCVRCVCVPACVWVFAQVCSQGWERGTDFDGSARKQTERPGSSTLVFDLLLYNDTLKWDFLKGRNLYTRLTLATEYTLIKPNPTQKSNRE